MKRQIITLNLPDDAQSLIAPFEDDYALLLVIASPSISMEQRDRITSDIVTSRCQYALNFGHDCALWHDMIDEACIGDGTGKERFLMTTWHDNEPIADVIDFLWSNTFYDNFKPKRLAIVQIGFNDELKAAISKRLSYHQNQPS